MKKYLNLFKALPVQQRSRGFSTKYMDKGVLVEDSVLLAYGGRNLPQLVQDLVPANSQMNQTFHKSWRKVRDASIEQLVAEQITHYFTTYGLERMGLYNEETVYIPNEQLELEDEGGITFYTLRGITADEIGARVRSLISSGMALSDSDLNDLVDVIKEQKLSINPADSKNKEMRVRLYNMLGITPEDPTEYLRLQVFRATDSTLLIKSKDSIEAIKASLNKDAFGKSTNVFRRYEEEYGLAGLASIFYRFKPIFLAFKNKASANSVNRIRKMAVKHHKPMPEDYLSATTKHLRNGTFEVEKLQEALKRSNTFRKVKLAQALQLYGNTSLSGIVYSIRNGKSYATTANPLGANVDDALFTVMDSLAKDLEHLRDKKIYMDAGLVAPTSGKMFCGDVPFGSHFSSPESLVLGVSWKDISTRVDLDLSILSVSGKTGWDGRYRNDDFLFSGDITSAPKGATEAHLVRKKAKDGIYLLNLNYYNGYEGNEDVPFILFVAKEEEYKQMDKNAMMSRSNMLFWAESSISSKHKQKVIGVLKIKDGVKTFHAFELKTGKGISSRSDEKSRNTIAFYDKYLESLLDLRTLVEWAGAKLVSSPDEADIDLSMASLTKDTLMGLMTGR